MRYRGPLESELLRLRAAQLDTADVTELAAWDGAAAAAAEARVAAAALAVGERVDTGSTGRPLVVTWYLSSHSAFCRAALSALAAVFAAEGGTGGGTELHVLTPEHAERAAGLRAELGLPFPLHHDPGEHAAAFGIRYPAPPEFRSLLCLDDLAIPLPAAYVLGPDGAVRERFVHPDSRFRAEPEVLLRAAGNRG